jgi:hypothetical protein
VCQCSSELWRFHPDYRGSYEVSTCGRVRSLDRLVPFLTRWGKTAERLHRGRVLAPKADEDGRARVELSVAGVHRTRLVHQLVLETFVSPRPPGLLGCHWDGNNQNNHVTNLRWDTYVANCDDQRRHGTHWQVQKALCPLDHLLVTPNLVPSQLPYRACLACNRANACLSRARRLGRPFDLRAEADRRYAQIMGRVPGSLAVEAS